MKPNLQRIEATLHQLATPAQPESKPRSIQFNPPVRVLPAVPESRPLSFDVRAKAASEPTPSVAQTSETAGPGNATRIREPQPELGNLNNLQIPRLPNVKAPGFTTHRNAANPALAMNLLKDIEGVVSQWQEELQQLLRQIQDLYLEGPIVDGWLESYSQEDEVPAFRHVDVNCLMDYVEKHWGNSSEPPIASSTDSSDNRSHPEVNPSGYRLCGLNEDGQLWFRHCPAEQVPVVSLAIARYQKLRQLLVRKQYLDTHLSQLAESLVVMHSQLNH